MAGATSADWLVARLVEVAADDAPMGSIRTAAAVMATRSFDRKGHSSLSGSPLAFLLVLSASFPHARVQAAPPPAMRRRGKVTAMRTTGRGETRTGAIGGCSI